MKKILIIIFILCVISGLVFIFKKASSTTPEMASNGKKLNVIVIDVCTLRADHLSYNGYFRNTSPHLDALAKESAVFNNFWTSSGWCLPNLTSLLTGTRPDTHQMLLPATSKLPSSLKTLQQIFKDNGYETAGFSGSRYMTDRYGLDKGFDTFSDPYKDSMTAMSAMSYKDNQDKVNAWLDEHKDTTKPFFLYLTVDDLHSPYPSENPTLYDPGYNGILNSVPHEMDKTTDYDIGGLYFDRVYNGEVLPPPNSQEAYDKAVSLVQDFKNDPTSLTHLNARYDAAIHQTDGILGGIIDKIKAENMWDNSIIILTGHQGELLGEHNLLGHVQGLYNPILSVPLIVHIPNSPENGKRINALTERTDISATILDSAGILQQNNKQFIGNSFLPLLEGKTIPAKKYIFASSKPTRLPNDTTPEIEERAVRNDQYELLWFKYKPDQYELYDLKNDHAETTNLVTTKPEVFQELKAQLDTYVKANSK